jgi:hypothetical protein
MTVETLPISADPSFEVTPRPQEERAVEEANDYLKVGLLIGAGFLVWRKLVVDSVPSLAEPTTATLSEVLEDLAIQHGPSWLKLVMPGFKKAYQIGAHNALDDDELEYLAQVYATEVGDYIHQTSAKAVMEGFNALVNQRWSPQIAYRRAFEGFGLTSDQMKSYISSMESLDKTYLPNALTDDPRIKSTVEKMLTSRSISIGENEAYTAQEMGRQIMWMQADQQGLLPVGIQRQWKTAKDELVCPTCAPMNNTTVDLYEKFEVEGRCWVELIEPDREIEKAYDPTRTPRGGNPKNRGQFSRSWGSRTLTTEMTPEQDRVVDQIIADALKSAKTEDKVTSPFASPFNSPFKSAIGTKSALNFAELKSAVPQSSLSTFVALPPSAEMKSSAMKAAKLAPAASINESVRIYFKDLKNWKTPFEQAADVYPGERTPDPPTVYGFALSLPVAEGDVVDFSNQDTIFSGDHTHALHEATNSWVDYEDAVSYLISQDPDYAEEWSKTYLEVELGDLLATKTDAEKEDIAAFLNIGTIPGVEPSSQIVSKLSSAVIGATPPDDRIQEMMFGGNDPNSFNEALMSAYSKAADEIINADLAVMDSLDQDRYFRRAEIIQESLAANAIFIINDELTGAMPVPTVYEITDPAQLVSTRKSGFYQIPDKYVVASTTYDFHVSGDAYDFPWVLMVTLVPLEQSSINKSLDPFGVVHLGVK